MVVTTGDRPAPAGHEGLLAASDEHRRTATRTWVRSALDRGERLLTLAVPVTDGITAVGGRRTTALTPDDLRTTAAPVGLLERALTDGHRGLAVVIHADAVIGATSRDTHDRIETVLTDLCRDHAVSVLCLYDRAGAGHDHLDLVTAHHGGGLHDRQLTLHRTPDTLRVDGEVDMTNLDVLGAALHALTHAPSPAVRIDLTGATFLAAAAAHLLAHGTARYREGGAHVEIRAAPRTIRILRLLDIDALPRVHVATRRPPASTAQHPAPPDGSWARTPQ